MSTVSVIIPAYNGERFLGEALASVLAQRHADLEVIVVDDGSTDGSVALARGTGDARVRVVTQANAGVSAARNRGAGEARGEYLAFLDQDDAWLPDKLTRQLQCFGQVPRPALVYTDFMVVAEDGTALYRWSERQELYRGDVFEALIPGPAVTLSTILVRRADFEAVGGFRPRYRYVEDLDLILRVLARGPLEVVPDPLVRYRVHAGSTTRALGIEVATTEVIALGDDLMARHPARRAALRLALGQYLYTAGKTAFYQERPDLAARYMRDSLRNAPAWRTRVFATAMRIAPGVVRGIRRLVTRNRVGPGV